MKLVFVQKNFSYFSYLYILCYQHNKNCHKNHHKKIIHSVLYCATVQKTKTCWNWRVTRSRLYHEIFNQKRATCSLNNTFHLWHLNLRQPTPWPVETRLWICGTNWCKNSQLPATKKLSGSSLSSLWEVFQDYEGECFQRIWFHCWIESSPENMTFRNIYCESVGK